MLPLDEYEALRKRPEGRPAMSQRWRDLSFLHFSAEPSEIQALLPHGLEVDTYPDRLGAERAWIGLVPFRMQGVTPKGIPPVPGCHAFPETNVRTYVHRKGKRAGVWFFSLDASNAFACRVARRLYSLPYWHTTMAVQRTESGIIYSSARRQTDARVELEATIGDPVQAAPGSLEFFLAERYLLYSKKGSGLYTGQVYHTPYPLRALAVERVRETVMASNGIRPRPFEHALFSEGVDVDVYSLQPI